MLALAHKTITVASDEELKDPDYYTALWKAVREQTFPRRDWLDAIADAIRDFEGDILNPDGTPFDIPLVDDIFGDDPDLRWIGYFEESKPDIEQPKRVTRKLERLRLLDLYYRLKNLVD